MKHPLLFALFSLVTLAPAFAAEDSQSVLNQSETATAVMGDASHIAKQANPLRFLLGGGITFGGDKLASAKYSDGSTDSVSAGDGFLFYGGLDYRLADAISLQGTLGYHFDKTKSATNGGITFSRMPLDLLVYYHVNDKFRLGGGMQIVNSPELKGKGAGGASNANASFANTTGLVIEGEYMMGKAGIKVRHVSESYKPTGSPVSIDGSHFGVLVNLYF